jgi:hypothetical protein
MARRVPVAFAMPGPAAQGLVGVAEPVVTQVLAEAAELAVTQALGVSAAMAVLLELVVTQALAVAAALAALVARVEAAAPVVAAAPAVVMAPAVRVDRSKIHLPAIAKRRELRQVKPRTLPYPSSELCSS